MEDFGGHLIIINIRSLKVNNWRVDWLLGTAGLILYYWGTILCKGSKSFYGESQHRSIHLQLVLGGKMLSLLFLLFYSKI